MQEALRKFIHTPQKGLHEKTDRWSTKATAHQSQAVPKRLDKGGQDMGVQWDCCFDKEPRSLPCNYWADEEQGVFCRQWPGTLHGRRFAFWRLWRKLFVHDQSCFHWTTAVILGMVHPSNSRRSGMIFCYFVSFVRVCCCCCRWSMKLT